MKAQTEIKLLLGVIIVLVSFAILTIPSNRGYTQPECQFIGMAFLAKDVELDTKNLRDVPPKLISRCDDGTVRFEEVPSGEDS